VLGRLGAARSAERVAGRMRAVGINPAGATQPAPA